MVMRFELSYDNEGKPVHVSTFDGFAHISRPFDPDTDGWMEDQLDPREFPAIRAGRDMEALVNEVNQLRRENFRLKQSDKQWMKSAGFNK